MFRAIVNGDDVTSSANTKYYHGYFEHNSSAHIYPDADIDYYNGPGEHCSSADSRPGLSGNSGRHIRRGHAPVR